MQQLISMWEEDGRRSAQVHDWTCAMNIDHELTRASQDIDVRAWRARVLTRRRKTCRSWK